MARNPIQSPISRPPCHYLPLHIILPLLQLKAHKHYLEPIAPLQSHHSQYRRSPPRPYANFTPLSSFCSPALQSFKAAHLLSPCADLGSLFRASAVSIDDFPLSLSQSLTASTFTSCSWQLLPSCREIDVERQF